MIYTDPSARLLALHTTHTSYWMGVDETGRLLHLYYGPLRETPPAWPEPYFDPGGRPDRLPQEWPCPGLGDNHAPFFAPEWADGAVAAEMRFAGVKTRAGKYALPGLPAFRIGEDPGAETLRITLKDDRGLTLTLLYGVLPGCDVITRAAVLENTGEEPITLRGMPSAVLDFARSAHPALDFITFDGAWAAERTPCRAPVRPGVQAVGSVGGIPTHAHNPFVMLCTPDAGEDCGECWGAALVYSGNYRMQAESTPAGVRLSVGIEPFRFAWTLAPGGRFIAPEAAFVYSGAGFGPMSRCFHRAIRRHLLPARWADMAAPRPVLLNSWEACYFDFDEAKLLRLAAAAKAAGCDLFVLDDGWFKGRNDDTSSLGDWVADPAKLPEGIDGLCRKVNDLGLAFGLWVEPEAVNPDSDLYRAHPDWALQIPGRETLALRHQYTLDFSRADVREGVWRQLTALLDSCPVAYVKWDMNRTLANVYSAALPAARQGEVYHRYVLGVYELQQRLTDRYPDLLLENCAGGGARFDCGMLYYAPQIWTSDNTDALDRLMIQYGTSFCYPPCVMGAHYSTVPNHTTHRTASVEARMAAALAGTFGFELDLTAYTAAEIEALHPFVQFYRDHGALVRGGELYRLAAPRRPGRGVGHRRGGRQRGRRVCGGRAAGRPPPAAALCRPGPPLRRARAVHRQRAPAPRRPPAGRNAAGTGPAPARLVRYPARLRRLAAGPGRVRKKARKTKQNKNPGPAPKKGAGPGVCEGQGDNGKAGRAAAGVRGAGARGAGGPYGGRGSTAGRTHRPKPADRHAPPDAHDADTRHGRQRIGQRHAQPQRDHGQHDRHARPPQRAVQPVQQK